MTETTTGWRPIAEAPKDGTYVLLGWLQVDPKGLDDDRWIAISGWYESGPADRCWYDAFDERVYPTHWMELVASPVRSPLHLSTAVEG
jgi:hypothetical protein